MEEWRDVIEFPGYSVSSGGVVRNDRRDTALARLVNKEGISYVSLFRDGRQHSRSVSHIVANAYLEPPPHPSFNSTIHLDGDRFNDAAFNLMWRPRWFSHRYHRQFQHKAPPGTRPDIPIEEVKTRERFADVWFAVMTFGLIWSEVYTAAWNYTYHSSPNAEVWPTRQVFKILKTTY